ncbi:hypothetical protein [Parafilimonas terrae]|uniref:Beta-glucosidase n=1 Tax=Parafilimonas terrae TaxID=1465490 RepID=A0A1I5TD03_9BACT|nr:hypothetical protein [Parafilimonas terrae]SFP80912.1 beta-glucosidase [Parafilimonas terrae]
MFQFFNHNTGKHRSILCLFCLIFAITANAQKESPDLRAAETEKKLTDDERFQMVYSVIGSVPSIGMPRDPRIPEGVSMSAGYTPGIPRLGIPAIQKQ